MKKLIPTLLCGVMALSVCTAGMFAIGAGRGANFTDADGDGICDNIGANCRFTDADGDGVCDVCGQNTAAGSWCGGRGQNFVDADQDGVCDHRETGCLRPMDGTGRKLGFQGGGRRAK